MAVDSSASFKARMLSLGRPQSHVTAFENRRASTNASFAFICPYQPSSQDEKPVTDALENLFGSPPGDYLPVVQDLRSRLESLDAQEPRKRAMPERMERLNQLRAALTGLTLDAQLQPSHALVDHVVSMAEDQYIHYLT